MLCRASCQVGAKSRSSVTRHQTRVARVSGFFQIRLSEDALRAVGLELATDKTAIIAMEQYVGPRTIRVGDVRVDVLSSQSTIRVLGLEFSFECNAHRQARDLIAKARAGYAVCRPIRRSKASWARVLRSLVESCLSWVAAAARSLALASYGGGHPFAKPCPNT